MHQIQSELGLKFSLRRLRRFSRSPALFIVQTEEPIHGGECGKEGVLRKWKVEEEREKKERGNELRKVK